VLRIIDVQTDPSSKSVLRGESDSDCAHEFCQAIENGTAEKWFRSEAHPTAKGCGLIERLVSDNVSQFVASGLVVLGVFDASD